MITLTGGLHVKREEQKKSFKLYETINNMNDKQDIACQWNLLPKNIFSWHVTQCVFHAGLTQVSNQVTWTSEMYYSFVQIKIKKSNQIRIISRNMTYKEVTNWYKMVHKRQTDKQTWKHTTYNTFNTLKLPNLKYKLDKLNIM